MRLISKIALDARCGGAGECTSTYGRRLGVGERHGGACHAVGRADGEGYNFQARQAPERVDHGMPEDINTTPQVVKMGREPKTVFAALAEDSDDGWQEEPLDPVGCNRGRNVSSKRKKSGGPPYSGGGKLIGRGAVRGQARSSCPISL